jgi:hypothetical protein
MEKKEERSMVGLVCWAREPPAISSRTRLYLLASSDLDLQTAISWTMLGWRRRKRRAASAW